MVRAHSEHTEQYVQLPTARITILRGCRVSMLAPSGSLAVGSFLSKHTYHPAWPLFHEHSIQLVWGTHDTVFPPGAFSRCASSTNITRFLKDHTEPSGLVMIRQNFPPVRARNATEVSGPPAPSTRPPYKEGRSATGRGEGTGLPTPTTCC